MEFSELKTEMWYIYGTWFNEKIAQRSSGFAEDDINKTVKNDDSNYIL